MGEKPEDSPTQLDYMTPRGGEPEWGTRQFVELVVAGAAVCAITTAWIQIGIRWGQWIEGQPTLFKPATGTAFWDIWAIGMPLLFLFGSCLALGGVALGMVLARRWQVECLMALPVILLLAFVTLFGNMPLMDAASP